MMGVALRLAGTLAGGALIVLLGLPLLGLLFRVEPAQLVRRLGEPAVLDALRLSLITSTAAAIVVVVLGLPLAYLLAQGPFRGRRLLETLVDLPMVLPPTVAGLALLLAFGRMGLAGRALGSFGVSLPFTTLAVVVAQVFMSVAVLRPCRPGRLCVGGPALPRGRRDPPRTRAGGLPSRPGPAQPPVVARRAPA